MEPLTVSLPGLVRNNVTLLPRNGGPNETPYFPATSIRGALRHAAHRIALRAAKETTGRPHPFDLNVHFMLAQGVDAAKITKKDAGGVIDYGQSLRAVNPMLSLFGRWGLESSLSVGNAFPEGNARYGLFGAGARGVMFERDPALLEELTPADQKRLDIILDEMAAFSLSNADLKEEETRLKKRFRTAAQDARDDLKSRLDDIDHLRKNMKAEKEGPEQSIRRPLNGYEAFAAGTVLKHRMSLQNSNDAELGFFLDTLAEFARWPRLGGHKALNNGLVAMRYEVSTWPIEAAGPVNAGLITVNEDGFAIEGDALIEARARWRTLKPQFDFAKVATD